ncbi:hypothetical protein ISF_08234 [Cordyceps fumosorosea ARSEF 2679]|uniref:Uncharacterized protein n=1 Tax=Cordyceps fumosorosea (strain ARSEF 2679) TaxID=1081104 RepID=A0A167MQ67_CORFA|nr:hypothetical protein ISF_08234 [Cordyceps fumosorosea ARSEF 2679]OAA54633.1 hypothetical protein ISF_08234 [Cordyceps fumosorosea ARSEF 2679]
MSSRQAYAWHIRALLLQYQQQQQQQQRQQGPECSLALTLINGVPLTPYQKAFAAQQLVSLAMSTPTAESQWARGKRITMSRRARAVPESDDRSLRSARGARHQRPPPWRSQSDDSMPSRLR